MKIQIIFTLPEEVYHDNKRPLKKLYKEYDMKWMGYYPVKFKWSDGSNTLDAEYDKDSHYDDYNREQIVGATQETRLIYKGEDNDFYKALKKYLSELNINGIAPLTDEAVAKIATDEKNAYIQMVENKMECLRRDGAPQSFIEHKRKILMEKCPNGN